VFIYMRLWLLSSWLLYLPCVRHADSAPSCHTPGGCPGDGIGTELFGAVQLYVCPELLSSWGLYVAIETLVVFI
jgi:hypothetical protein